MPSKITLAAQALLYAPMALFLLLRIRDIFEITRMGITYNRSLDLEVAKLITFFIRRPHWGWLLKILSEMIAPGPTSEENPLGFYHRLARQNTDEFAQQGTLIPAVPRHVLATASLSHRHARRT